MSTAPFRRIVTGHNAQGKAIIVEDAPAPQRRYDTGLTAYQIWRTGAAPARIDRVSSDGSEAKAALAPPKNGTVIRIADFPPESAEMRKMSPEQARAHFAEFGATDVLAHGSGRASPHPLMHRTETIDYAIVLDGEMTLIVDEGETVVRAGDVVIQRGTNHAWSNQSGKNCRIAFILIDGKFDPDLA